MGAFGAILAAFLVVSGFSVSALKKFSVSSKTIQPQSQLSIQIVQSTILQGIKNIKELATIRMSFQSVAQVSSDKKILGKTVPFSKRKLSVSYTGTAVCGCDLEKVTVANKFLNTNHVVINVPTSKFLDIYPDVGSFKVHEKKSQFFSAPIDIEIQDKAVAADIEDMKCKLIEDGILLKSNENIRQILKSLTIPLGVVAEINFIDEEIVNQSPVLLPE